MKRFILLLIWAACSNAQWSTTETAEISTTSVPDITPYQTGVNPDVANALANLLSNTLTEAQYCQKALLVNSQCQRALVSQVWTLKDPTACLLGPEKRYCEFAKNENCVTGPGGKNGFAGFFIPFCAPLPAECSDCETLDYTQAKPMIDLGGMGALGNLLGGNAQMNLGDLNPLVAGAQQFQSFFDIFKMGKRR